MISHCPIPCRKSQIPHTSPFLIVCRLMTNLKYLFQNLCNWPNCQVHFLWHEKLFGYQNLLRDSIYIQYIYSIVELRPLYEFIIDLAIPVAQSVALTAFRRCGDHRTFPGWDCLVSLQLGSRSLHKETNTITHSFFFLVFQNPLFLSWCLHYLPLRLSLLSILSTCTLCCDMCIYNLPNK